MIFPNSKKTKRKLSETDLNYNIIAAGKELDIPLGENVTVVFGEKEYPAKMHNTVKGRIDRLGAFYAENSFVVGEELELEGWQRLYVEDWYITVSKIVEYDINDFLGTGETEKEDDNDRNNYINEKKISTVAQDSLAIKAGQYQRSDFVSFTIPDGVMHIGRDAFAHCKNLKEIIIPDGVVCIDECAFFGCSSLEKVQLPESLRYLGAASFYNCESLQKIEIPRQITVIPTECFVGCKSLNEVKILGKVRIIMGYAFMNCVSLNSFSLYCNERLNAILNGAFRGCGNLVFETLDQRVIIADCGHGAIGAGSVMIDKEAFDWGQLTIRTFPGTSGAKLAEKHNFKVEYVKDYR